MAIRTWNSGASTDLNNGANYTGAGALLATDDLVFNNTSVVNATATANLSVNSITVAATYSGNMSFSGRTATYANGDASFDGTGTLNLGNAITLNGASATLHVGAGVGVVTASLCAVTMNGTTAMVIDDDKGTSFKSLTLGANAVVTNNGAASSTYYNSATCMTLGNGSSYTSDTAINLRMNASDVFISIGSGCTINGAAAIVFRISGNNLTGTLPAITTLNTPISIREYTTYTGWTIRFDGAINIGTATLIAHVYVANSTGTIDFNNQNITCGDFVTGISNASNTGTFNYGSGTFNISSFTGSTYNAAGTCTENFQTSIWNCNGNWTFGSNHTVNRGTSSVTITNTSTVTSNAKLFGNFTYNSAGRVLTIADAFSVNNYTMTAGSQTGNFSTTCSGDALFSVTSTLFRLIMTKATTRTITVLGGGTLTLTNLTNTNVNGAAGALTQWRSTVAGTRFNLVIPAAITLTFQYPRDSSVDDTITVTDGSSTNGGNNFNWLFNVVITSATYLGNHRWQLNGSGFMPVAVAPTATIDGVAVVVEAGATDSTMIIVENIGTAAANHLVTVTNSGGQAGTITIFTFGYSSPKANMNIGVHIL